MVTREVLTMLTSRHVRKSPKHSLEGKDQPALFRTRDIIASDPTQYRRSTATVHEDRRVAAVVAHLAVVN